MRFEQLHEKCKKELKEFYNSQPIILEEVRKNLGDILAEKRFINFCNQFREDYDFQD